MHAYCQELKVLANQLESVDAPINESDLILQTLAGLTEQYETVQTVIQNTKPLPSFLEVRSQLCMSETTKQIKLYILPTKLPWLFISKPAPPCQLPLNPRHLLILGQIIREDVAGPAAVAVLHPTRIPPAAVTPTTATRLPHNTPTSSFPKTGLQHNGPPFLTRPNTLAHTSTLLQPVPTPPHRDPPTVRGFLGLDPIRHTWLLTAQHPLILRRYSTPFQ
ncbi:hypothetical protein HanRHA438_Chr11g0510341 [Helianthus annuus]|nr:hypothetical protein HanIR_Chr11g0535851 [Helianthus annuus]KAJ0871268.1 hypothetical protein HanRHA438_Chr11g0510341 [Helianthus annuus]